MESPLETSCDEGWPSLNNWDEIKWNYSDHNSKFDAFAKKLDNNWHVMI